MLCLMCTTLLIISWTIRKKSFIYFLFKIFIFMSKDFIAIWIYHTISIFYWHLETIFLIVFLVSSFFSSKNLMALLLYLTFISLKSIKMNFFYCRFIIHTYLLVLIASLSRLILTAKYFVIKKDHVIYEIWVLWSFCAKEKGNNNNKKGLTRYIYKIKFVLVKESK